MSDAAYWELIADKLRANGWCGHGDSRRLASSLGLSERAKGYPADLHAKVARFSTAKNLPRALV